jgi:alpha/beta superfamily hydrolase
MTEKKKIMRLPPPEPNPPRSPDAKVRGEEAITVDGPVALEARVRVPPRARRAVVITHPHPLYGGSMHSPVPLAIAKTLADLGGDDVAWLRFNFRGVGASGGIYDDGRGETDDVVAAIADLRRRAPGAAMSVCGHSFGSWTGLRGAIADGGVERVALVAPSVRFFEFGEQIEAHFRGPLAVIIGDEDEFSEVSEARDLATKLGAEIRVLTGFDHHFLKSRRQMAETVVAFIAPEAKEPPLA